jgi:hypothetical protein
LVEQLWGYIAGITDGEGSITFTMQRGFHRRVRITVPQSGPDGLSLLNGLRADTGLGRVKLQGRKPRRLPAYVWTIDRQVECLMFLNNVRPFLRLKIKAADIAIALLLEKAAIRSQYYSPNADVWNCYKNWEPHELTILKERYDNRPETLDELCRLLKRTRKGIHIKAWKMGLKSPRGNHFRRHTGESFYSLIRGGHKLQAISK